MRSILLGYSLKHLSNLVLQFYMHDSIIVLITLLYRTVGQLGSGQFANVEKAVWSRSHGVTEVAVKTLHSDASPTDKLKLLQEGAITSQFRHPNVVFLHGIIIADTNKVLNSYQTDNRSGIHA